MSDNSLDETQSTSIKSALITLIVTLIIIPFILFGFAVDEKTRNNPKSKVIIIIIYLVLIIISCLIVYFLVGMSTANEACLEGKINQTAVFTSSLPTLIFSVISIILVVFVPQFFRQPFESILGNNLGYGLAVGVNLAGAAACGALVCYFSVFQNGCQVGANPNYYPD